MDYKNVTFNANVVALYLQIHERMAGEFADSFGPVELSAPANNLTEMSQEELKEHNVWFRKSCAGVLRGAQQNLEVKSSDRNVSVWYHI